MTLNESEWLKSRLNTVISWHNSSKQHLSILEKTTSIFLWVRGESASKREFWRLIPEWQGRNYFKVYFIDTEVPKSPICTWHVRFKTGRVALITRVRYETVIYSSDAWVKHVNITDWNDPKQMNVSSWNAKTTHRQMSSLSLFPWEPFS